MTAERLQEIKARLAKPTPEPFKSLLEELVQAVEGKPKADPMQALAGRLDSERPRRRAREVEAAANG